MKRVRAIIVQDNKILLIKRTKPEAVYWVIPGGGVEMGETDKQAIKRECLEELGLEVKVGQLFLQMASKKPGMEGWMECFYLCEIIGGQLGTGQGPEFAEDTVYTGGYSIEWRKISDLKNIDLKPEEIKRLIASKYGK